MRPHRAQFGAFGGKLTKFSATDLAVHATKAALTAGNVPAAAVDTVVVGNVSQTSSDAAYLARHVALKSGMATETPALNINRLCGSGFQSVVNVAQEIALGEAEIGVAAGTESMSQAPMSVYGQNVRFGTKLGVDLKQVDTLWAGLTDTHGGANADSNLGRPGRCCLSHTLLPRRACRCRVWLWESRRPPAPPQPAPSARRLPDGDHRREPRVGSRDHARAVGRVRGAVADALCGGQGEGHLLKRDRPDDPQGAQGRGGLRYGRAPAPDAH